MLEALEDARDGLALTDAHRRNPVARLPALELVEQRRRDTRARRTERVAECDIGGSSRCR